MVEFCCPVYFRRKTIRRHWPEGICQSKRFWLTWLVRSIKVFPLSPDPAISPATTATTEFSSGASDGKGSGKSSRIAADVQPAHRPEAVD